MQQEDLDELIAMAGEADEPPPDPQGGIPKQWLPRFIRWPVRILFLPFIWMDLGAQKIARLIIRPPFIKVGACLKRGNCCHYILLPKMKGLLKWITFFWNTQINGFYLRSSESYPHEGKKMLVMGCRYLKKDGSCAQYHLRPMVCRQWPRIEYFGYPQMLKGCGFRAEQRSPPKSKPQGLNIIE